MMPSLNFDSVSVLVSQVLVHFLWQGLALGVIAAVTTGLLHHRKTARAWHASQVTLLALLIACPIVTAVVLANGGIERPPTHVTAGSGQPRAELASSAPLAAPHPDRMTASDAPSPRVDESTAPLPSPPSSDKSTVAIAPSAADDADLTAPTVAPNATPLSPAPPAPDRGRVERIFPVDLAFLAPYIAAGYAAGFFVMLLRLGVGVYGGHRLRRASEPVTDRGLLDGLAAKATALGGLRSTPALAYCGRVAVPTVVGVIRPMILLPVHIQTGFTIAQIELLLLHEIAHLRRYDHLVNLLQRVAEALLFFHPAVWYVSRQIALSREHCCDDLVLQHGGQPADYAKLLVQAEEHAHGDVPLAALSATGKPSQLRRRVARILGADLPVKLGRTGLLAFAATVIIAASALAVLAASQTEDARREEPVDAVSDAAGEQEDEPDSAEAELDAEVPTRLAQAPDDEGDAETTQEEAPPEMRPELIDQLLRAKDSWLRKVAASEAGASGNRAYVPYLADVLTDDEEDIDVRAAAARALGEIGDPDSVPYLVAALRYVTVKRTPEGERLEQRIRDAAAKALAQIDHPIVMEFLRRAMNDDDPALQTGAYLALGEIGSPETLGLLEQALRSDDVMRVLSAFRALLLNGGDEGQEVLLAALKTGDLLLTGENSLVLHQTEVRETLQSDDKMLRVLARQLIDRPLSDGDPSAQQWIAEQVLRRRLLDPEPAEEAKLYVAAGKYDVATRYGELAVEPLIEALGRIPEGELRSHQYNPLLPMIQALGQIGDTAAFPALTDLLNHETNSVAWAALEAIAQIGTEAAIPALIRGLQSFHRDVRQGAAYYLAEMQPEAAVEALITSLNDLDDSVRAKAAEALGAIGDARAVPALAEAMDDPLARVRQAVAKALGALGDPIAVHALAEALEDSDQAVRQAAANALGRIGDPSAVPGLSEALDDPEAQVRAQAAGALGQIGDPSVIPALVEAWDDSQNRVRDEAILAIQRIGGPEAVGALIEGIGSDDSRVQLAAAQALEELAPPEAVSTLIATFKAARSESVRMAAARALGEIGDSSALPVFIEFLQGSINSNGRTTGTQFEAVVVEALGKIGDPSALPILESLYQKYRLGLSMGGPFPRALEEARQKLEEAAAERDEDDSGDESSARVIGGPHAASVKEILDVVGKVLRAYEEKDAQAFAAHTTRSAEQAASELDPANESDAFKAFKRAGGEPERIEHITLHTNEAFAVTAPATQSGERLAWRLVRDDGRWLVDDGDFVDDAEFQEFLADEAQAGTQQEASQPVMISVTRTPSGIVIDETVQTERHRNDVEGSTTLSEEPGDDATARASAEEDVTPPVLSVHILADGVWRVNGNRVQNEAALLRLAQEAVARDANVTAVVRGDNTAPVKRLMQTLDLLEQSKVKQFSIRTLEPSQVAEGKQRSSTMQ